MDSTRVCSGATGSSDGLFGEVEGPWWSMPVFYARSKYGDGRIRNSHRFAGSSRTEATSHQMAPGELVRFELEPGELDQPELEPGELEAGEKAPSAALNRDAPAD